MNSYWFFGKNLKKKKKKKRTLLRLNIWIMVLNISSKLILKKKKVYLECK